MAEAAQAGLPSARSWWKSPLATLAFAALLGLLALFPYARALQVPMWVDEGVFAYMPWASQVTGEPLYHAGEDNKPPGIFLLYRLVQAYDQAGVTRVRFLQGAMILAVALALAAWLRRSAGAAAGAVGALAWVLLATFQPDIRALTEVPMVVGTTVGFWLVYLGLQSGRAGQFLAAGLALGVAFQFKQTAAMELAGAVLLALAWPGGRPGAQRLRAAGGIAVGFTAVFGATLLWLWTSGQVAEWWQATVASVLSGDSGISSAERMQQLEMALRHFFPTKALLAVFMLAALGLGWRYAPRPLGTVLVVWFAAAALACLMRGSLFEHQATQFFPPLAGLAAVGLAGLCRSLSGLSRSWGALLVGVLLLVTFAPLALAYARGLERPYQGIPAETGWRDVATGQWLREHLPPEERVYVVGDGVPVYLYAQRLAPTRQFHTIALTPSRAESVLAALRESRPGAVALTFTYREADTQFRGRVARLLADLGYRQRPEAAPEGYEVYLREDVWRGGQRFEGVRGRAEA